MDFAEFKEAVYRRFGLYLDGYKEPQLKRRIDSLMALLQVPDYGSYLNLLARDGQQWQRFIDKITINVSEFFRNQEIFVRLEQEILPSLLATFRDLKVWSAGCADGPEPYSVAILLAELAPGGRHQILATDIDPGALAAARRGVYGERALQAVTPTRLNRYFRREGDHFYLQEQIKGMVDFRQHDLLKDAYGSGFHLIICRNVVIYFTAATQNDLYRRFYQALAPGGVFFIGATENLFQYRELGFEKIAPWFYRRPAGTS
ncbi:CheR family methyltransferase [Neomoorella thermoacetica]|uniref:CheR family methyltransferase n=1 Tax=Neomoorella thermoacetica TaxID=1525 RepID=UPI0008FB98CE|nr:protein-glutamate O-methyltransferase CheR [Moorella thermoacetica]APC07921.1 chemotaxis protein methyltransferase [Moorella thermoacetica]